MGWSTVRGRVTLLLRSVEVYLFYPQICDAEALHLGTDV